MMFIVHRSLCLLSLCSSSARKKVWVFDSLSRNFVENSIRCLRRSLVVQRARKQSRWRRLISYISVVNSCCNYAECVGRQTRPINIVAGYVLAVLWTGSRRRGDVVYLIRPIDRYMAAVHNVVRLYIGQFAIMHATLSYRLRQLPIFGDAV